MQLDKCFHDQGVEYFLEVYPCDEHSQSAIFVNSYCRMCYAKIKEAKLPNDQDFLRQVMNLARMRDFVTSQASR